MKKIFTYLILSIFLFSLVSASIKIPTMPDISLEEWKLKVSQANEKRFLATTSVSYWGICEQSCWSNTFYGDCRACGSDEIESACFWSPDGLTGSVAIWSANDYCNNPFKAYDYYNKQCYCVKPATTCIGGLTPGERMCVDNEIWACSSSGFIEYVSKCPYGCLEGICEQQTCIAHSTKKCYGGSVYWFDSCGKVQEEYLRCEADEKCEGNDCVRVCQEGFIGSKLCSGLDIVQQFQKTDCSTEIRTVDTCPDGCKDAICQNPQCSICSVPTSWSQCADDKMFRTNYKCDQSTNYLCQEFKEEQKCECGTSGQCSYDEVCESNVCVKLECEENEIADGHICIPKTNPLLMIGIIGGFVLLLFIILIIFLVIKLGKKK